MKDKHLFILTLFSMDTIVYDDEFVRCAFADMDSAVDLERSDIPKRDNTVCPNCDNGRLVYFCSGGHPGSAV